MLEENLTKLGFSPSEIKIYLHLLKHGANYANKISSETEINRTNVYEALDRLINKGVISFITRNKLRWFEAKSPESILSLIKVKEDEINTTKKDIISDIKNIEINPKNPLEANIFVGKKGLRMIFDEIIEAKQPISMIAAEFQFRDIFGPYFELWHKMRIENKIKQRTVLPKKFRSKVKQRKLLEYKFTDNINPTTTIIYGDNCLFIQWSKEPIAIKINNKEITKSHLNYFNMLWNS